MHLQFDLQQLWFSSNFWWYDKRFLWYNNMLAFSGHVIFVNLINHIHEYSINKGHIKVEKSLVFLPPHQQNFFHLGFTSQIQSGKIQNSFLNFSAVFYVEFPLKNYNVLNYIYLSDEMRSTYRTIILISF